VLADHDDSDVDELQREGAYASRASHDNRPVDRTGAHSESVYEEWRRGQQGTAGVQVWCRWVCELCRMLSVKLCVRV
jgi:hypothetical protein